MSEVPTAEVPLDQFLASCGDRTPHVFAMSHPSPFLLRDVLVGAETRKLSKEELQQQAERFRRITAHRGGAGYVLSQYGAPNIESLLRDVAVAGQQALETHVTPLRGAHAGPVTVGSGWDAVIVLPEKGGVPALAFTVAAAEGGFALTATADGIWYRGEPLAQGESAPLEEGQWLHLGAGADFQTFTPSGLALYAAFRARVSEAQARAGR
jgi:hypothetical protein